MFPVGELAVVQSVNQVVERPHSTYAEESDGELSPRVAFEPSRPSRAVAGRTTTRISTAASTSTQPIWLNGRLRPKRSATPSWRCVIPARYVVHVALELVVAMCAAERDGGHEHREEAVAMDEFGNPVGDEWPRKDGLGVSGATQAAQLQLAVVARMHKNG